MRWLVKSNGQTSGPMDEAMLAVLVKSGQVGQGDMFREESEPTWLPFSLTPFVPRLPSAVHAQLVTGPAKPSFDVNNLSLWQGVLLLGGLFVLVFGAVSIAGRAGSTTATVPAPPPPVAEEMTAPPPPPTLAQRLGATSDLSGAIAILNPAFEPTGSGSDPASAALATWAARHMTWKALQAIPETQRALVMKDPTAELGKRLCWSGSVVEIATDRTTGYPIYEGGIINDNMDVVRFYAVGDSGEVIEHAWARVCGIVTGAFAYPNSGGGTTHAARVVGMFDLPKNKAH